MMPPLPHTWKEEFLRAAIDRRNDILYREKIARAEKEEKAQRDKERIEEERYEAETLAMWENALVPPKEIAAFRVQLDDYDAKTVEALMDNRQALDTVRRRLDDMLEQAHVLPDGRRVFKTEDGTRVFDEHGTELAPNVIDPLAIDDKKPKWEGYRSDMDKWEQLRTERQQLHDYQAKLDEARERLDKGDITRKELDRIKGDLSATMPEAVRRKLDENAPDEAAPNKPKDNAAQPTDALDRVVRQSGLGTAPSAP